MRKNEKPDYEKLLARAAKICSTSEKCSHDMHQKLIDWGLDEAQSALQSISEKEYNSALDEMLQKKIKSTGDISDYAAKAKVIRFAAQRGFSQEDIYNALDRVGQE